MNISLLRSRTKLNLAASLADFNKLKADPSDISMVKYLATNFKTSSGGRFSPTDDDVLAGKYALAILTSLEAPKIDMLFRELMYYRAVGDNESYITVLGEHEKSFAEDKAEAT
jgi:hypothetical protein